MAQFEVSKTNQVRQLREKARYDEASVHQILDAGLVAQVGFIEDAAPLVVPMTYGRDGNRLFLHGARKARVIRMLEATPKVCVNVTLLDGIVYARSLFNSSMNYRSVTVHGAARLIEGEAKLHALNVISDHAMPGRREEVRNSHENEVLMTGVIELTIEHAAAKISAGPPDDEEADYASEVWAGVMPLRLKPGALIRDPKLPESILPTPRMQHQTGRVF
jgi:nitroimidazol reductase NimA-like FMN-containing flavoprotein (pyridoxamine 5'-phosphate oxidase superfamily)